MSTRIIDNSETIRGLQVSALSTTVIQHDSGSRTPQVTVTADSVNLGVSSKVIVHNDATLVVNGPANVGAASTLAIGEAGHVVINSALSLGLLSRIAFIQPDSTGPDDTLTLSAAAEHQLLGLLAGPTHNVGGFGLGDLIDLQGVSGVTHEAFFPNKLGLAGGHLDLYNAADQRVGTIGFRGAYTTANFNFSSSDHGTGTAITYHL